MKKSLRVRKRKAADRVRLRAQVRAGKVRAKDVSVSAALGPSFYRGPLGVSHICLDDDEFAD